MLERKYMHVFLSLFTFIKNVNYIFYYEEEINLSLEHLYLLEH